MSARTVTQTWVSNPRRHKPGVTNPASQTRHHKSNGFAARVTNPASPKFPPYFIIRRKSDKVKRGFFIAARNPPNLILCNFKVLFSYMRSQTGSPADLVLSQALLLGIYSDGQTARAVLRTLRHAQLSVSQINGPAPGETSGETPSDTTNKAASDTEAYRPFVLPGETLLLVRANSAEQLNAAYEIVRQGRGGRPATFVFDAEAAAAPQAQTPAPLFATPLSHTQQEAEARKLADLLGETDEKAGTGKAVARHLLAHLRRSETALNKTRTMLKQAKSVGQAVGLSGEWLLDNTYVISGHIDDVYRSLTPAFFAHLPPAPHSAPGAEAQMPRALAVAYAIVSANDARLDTRVIRDYVAAYQTVTPLRMSELWSLPLFLRLHLINVVQTVAARVTTRQHETELADFWASRLLTASRRAPDQIPVMVEAMQNLRPSPSAYLADQLVGHLYDDENALSSARGYLEAAGKTTLPELIALGQREQATDQITVSNAISSLRKLSTIDWSVVFERLSYVHTTLLADPSGVYPKMDFLTRDAYRHAVETIAGGSVAGEIEVAERARELSRMGEDDLRRHVGYYLVDKGRPFLEKQVGFRPDVPTRLRKIAQAKPAFTYVVSVALLSGLFALAAGFYGGGLWLGLLVFIALLPASGSAAQMINTLIIRFFAPDRLPRLDFATDGIPDDCRTLVVVPMMLLTPEAIAVEVERLEIRYLGNPDPALRFALLSDFADAPLQFMPDDAERLDAAVRGVESLNDKYGAGTFFLFHRGRVWSESEEAWIGWERKRGKLEALNAFLLNQSGAETGLLRVGSRRDLGNIRFVLTLDADTQLPRDAASRLIGTIAHPLNAPRLTLNGKAVDRGYTIIQPRVSTVLPSATETWFTRLFTPSAGTDPYTNTVSDVYQDFAHEGSYHGKGIYDLAAFGHVLHERFPAAHLLSHDLLEGSFVRVGLASDIELFDQFPRDYPAYARRQHRWVRGDWQIADWLLRRVPTGHGKAENPLGLLARWKIFDNLRRSLVPVASVVLLLLAWAISPSPLVWTILVAAPFLLPIPLSFYYLAAGNARFNARSWKQVLLVPLRALVDMALLPHQALLNLNAIGLVIERRFTRRHLLEWETAAETARRVRNRQKQFVQKLLWVPAASVALGAFLFTQVPQAFFVALPFLLLWALSPVAVNLLGKDAVLGPDPTRALTTDNKTMLRLTARQTWRYFDDFVGPETHYLPPDNYQEFEGVGVAPRTSPTNIGLGLLANLAAHDLGYITAGDAISRIQQTLDTVQGMEKYEGNLYNWYDTQNAKPLAPRYVSMVDSGNLLGNLWALEQGCDELRDAPLAAGNLLLGIGDTLGLLEKSLTAAETTSADPDTDTTDALNTLRRLTGPSVPAGLDGVVLRLRELVRPSARLVQKVAVRVPDPNAPAHYWANCLTKQVGAANKLVDDYLGWVLLLKETPSEGLFSLGRDAHEWQRQALEAAPSLQSLARGDVAGLAPLAAAQSRAESLGVSSEMRNWLQNLYDAFEAAQEAARVCVADINEAALQTSRLADEMHLRFMYAEDRRAFHIGFHVEERRADNSFYDLLASEARLGSFIAIARGEVPTQHWWALGRPYGVAFGRRVLLSWSGTMFEYLMPNLLMRAYDGSLLAEASEAAVFCQQAYGRERGMPWGVSEAAYSALDSGHNYQYFAFGVPGVGIKRGLEDGLVVAPYATALALMVAPAASVDNLAHLDALGVTGDRGFWESIDYTRQSGPGGERGVVVQTYMAHHQGMSLLAIDNLLLDNPMQRRFHANRRVAAAELLLHERVPAAPAITEGYEAEIPKARTLVNPVPVQSARSRIDRYDTHVPRTLLLSNNTYHVMVTNAGGGYSRWNDLELTRWRADATRDSNGTFIYLRDLDSQEIWSAAYQPTQTEPSYYDVQFAPERAEFRRRDNDIETITEIVVSPDDDAEVRRVTLINRSEETRRVELTSYSEISLAAHNADRAHMAFSKMFVRTEALAGTDGQVTALIAGRRPRSGDDPEKWMMAAVVGGNPAGGNDAGYETDRAAFLGRDNTPHSPAALSEGAVLGGATGSVLDPVFSLRRTLTLAPGASEKVTFVLGAGDSREAVVHLADKYRDAPAGSRAFAMAWNRAQLQIRHLGITPDEAQRFQQLAGSLLYPNHSLRIADARLAQNTLNQAGLWKFGVSGDLPILAVMIRELQDAYVVREILIAHTYWRLHGFKVDLLLLNEETASYDQPLLNQLNRLAQAHSQYTGIDTPGGVFVRGVADISREERTLLLSAARAVLIAARGPLAQQLALATEAPDALPVFVPKNPNADPDPAPELPFVERTEWNGYGGFVGGGRQYVIDREAGGKPTPQPWSNVLANPRFGTLITAAGSGFSWDGNSQTNRLTPWSNDWVSDPSADAIYLRDEETGHFWTTTQNPIVVPGAAYRTRHGQGYTTFEHESHGIFHEQTVFVPHDENTPAKIQILKLQNQTSRARKLTVTAYAEWVLGTEREETQGFVVTGWDETTNAVMARNAYRSDFGDRAAFLAASLSPASHTSDRTEFLGRNGQAAAPDALTRTHLSGRVGAGLDPCAALQIPVSLEPGETREIVFVLGEADNEEAAQELIRALANPDSAHKSLDETVAFWDDFLSTVSVETPDNSANVLVNRWLLYQDLCCRMWGRSAFYQSGGAFGFRDQLQDVLALVYAAPETARAQILRASAHQFEQGDVQHWWHPPGGAGVRTRITDDLLWLPFAVAHYVRVTGDAGILDESVSFLRGRELGEHEHEALFTPDVSPESASLLEHCRRAVKKGLTQSPLHGLPLIGGGDWNDGLNRVGVGGKGESVWLAWFIIHVLNDWAELLEASGEGGDTVSPEVAAEAQTARDNAVSLAKTVEDTAWDGAYYRRAYFDDGTPLGSSANDEARIDSLPQSWAVISGHADPDRAKQAMQSAEENLVRRNDGLVLLFTPPLDHTPLDPGYIKGYPPGVRENGGQYTHGSLWMPLAWARMKQGDKAVELLDLMSPVSHSRTQGEAEIYRVEPYVVAADIYALPGHEGRGGWTWYTGSAGWMYRVWLEEVLGFTLRRGNQLSLNPVLPDNWPGFTLRYRFGGTTYECVVERTGTGAKPKLTLDGTPVKDGFVTLTDDGAAHTVRVVLPKVG